MITLLREWLCKPRIEAPPNVRPPSNTRLYDGQWVTIVQRYDDGTVDIVHEDDRMNVRTNVLEAWLS